MKAPAFLDLLVIWRNEIMMCQLETWHRRPVFSPERSGILFTFVFSPPSKRFCSVAQAGLELKIPPCICLLSAGITGAHHYA
jgi:hypothetical protein